VIFVATKKGRTTIFSLLFFVAFFGYGIRGSATLVEEKPQTPQMEGFGDSSQIKSTVIQIWEAQYR
jgi:hypothetical protein